MSSSILISHELIHIMLIAPMLSQSENGAFNLASDPEKGGGCWEPE